MKLNQQFSEIRQSSTVALSDRLLALKASGRKIISLHVGDPDFETPAAIQHVAVKAMRDGLTHYVSSRGDPDLRIAVAVKLKRDNEVTKAGFAPYDPETEILITHGGIHAYYLALQSILNPGDEVLVPDPSWATHANMVKVLRSNAVPVPAPAESGFIPPIANWEKALTDKTRAIVINYPSNPTGMIPSREYLQSLQEFTRRYNLWMVSDEVYQDLYFTEKPISAGAFPGVKDRTLLVNSLSKTYAMTGWRVGYLSGPARVIENALKASQNSITCVAPFVQKAAAFALTDEGVQSAAEEMRSAYNRRRELVIQIYRDFPDSHVSVNPPQGAIYYFLDFRAFKMTSQVICERILEEAGVGLVPGSAFGKQGEGFVRMTIAASDENLEKGFSGILEWAKREAGG
ncbi:MAG: pyridoxal phosphate-dependent aminotransferase [Anaerolineales bacterium]|nr:pyridoxal phosphate-dependent aminotransferase [Anaerolineales bacterium]